MAPVNFANQVVPIFTKLGCNGGGCHGKSGGQNGFRLSLLGFEPPEDSEFLVKEGRERRRMSSAVTKLLQATHLRHVACCGCLALMDRRFLVAFVELDRVRGRDGRFGPIDANPGKR